MLIDSIIHAQQGCDSDKTNRRVNTQLGVIPREQGHHVLQFSKEELL